MCNLIWQSPLTGSWQTVVFYFLSPSGCQFYRAVLDDVISLQHQRGERNWEESIYSHFVMTCFWYLFLSLYSGDCISLAVKLWVVIYSGLTASHEKLRAVSFRAAESFWCLVRKDYTTWDFKCFVVFGAPDSLLLWPVGGSSVKFCSEILRIVQECGFLLIFMAAGCQVLWQLQLLPVPLKKSRLLVFSSVSRWRQVAKSKPQSTSTHTLTFEYSECRDWFLSDVAAAGEATGRFLHARTVVPVVWDVPVLSSSFLPKLGREEYAHDFQIKHKPGVPKRWEQCVAWIPSHPRVPSPTAGAAISLGTALTIFVPAQAFSLEPPDRVFLVWPECQRCKSSFKPRMCQVLSRCLLRVWSAVSAVSHPGAVWMWPARMTGEGVPCSWLKIRAAPRMCCSPNCAAPRGFLTLLSV